PGYREIRLSLASPSAIAAIIRDVDPTHVHIATEGPIGLSTRHVCLRQERTFTTSYHTRFPEYISARAPVPENWSYRALRRFHNAGRATLVSTISLERQLSERGFRNILRWTRGVDMELFHPRAERCLDFPGPLFLYVGRVSVEKNIEAFL
ncbi:glycosyltransferase, partial [Corallococcus exiguus]|uniref:glycosyltransferase n=1 Tax=Corallococcus exiguus TaxID=83462 RepID=UPI001474A2ED|nr:glycosyltransferase [Corallococcus exiguus]